MLISAPQNAQFATTVTQSSGGSLGSRVGWRAPDNRVARADTAPVAREALED